MKKMLKIMGGVLGVSAVGITAYTIMNKKLRNKALDLKDTMVDEAKKMMK